MKKFLSQVKAGFLWATDSLTVIAVFLLIYAAVNLLVAQCLETVLCAVLSVPHTAGMSYIAVALNALILLLHESGYNWPKKALKRPIGYLSAWYFYYLVFQVPWSILSVCFAIGPYADAVAVLASIVAGIAIVIFGHRNAKNIQMTTYRVPLPVDAAHFRIACLSDLHLGAFVDEDHVATVVDKVNSILPDIVIIAGDLIDDDPSFLKDAIGQYRVAQMISSIRSKYGVFMTLGNHDPNTDNSMFCSFLYRCGIQLLHDECVEFPEIVVVGRSDAVHKCRKPLKEILTDIPKTKPVLVVDHDPKHIVEAEEYGVDLVLSGHTHAGQFFPATIVTQLAVGKHRLYGHHKFGKTHSVITSGAGYFNIPIRIGTNNEVVEIII